MGMIFFVKQSKYVSLCNINQHAYVSAEIQKGSLLQVFLISAPVQQLSHRLIWGYRPAYWLFSQLRRPYLVPGLKPVTPQVLRRRWCLLHNHSRSKGKGNIFMAKYRRLVVVGGRHLKTETLLKLPLFATHCAGLQPHVCLELSANSSNLAPAAGRGRMGLQPMHCLGVRPLGLNSAVVEGERHGLPSLR